MHDHRGNDRERNNLYRGFGDAVGTYLHELGHSFGGDSSAAFSHALSEMLSATVRHAARIGDLQRAWGEVKVER